MKIIYLLVHEHKEGETILAFEDAARAFAMLQAIMTRPEYIQNNDTANIKPIELK